MELFQIKDIKQEEDDSRREWYQNDYFDLFIWYDRLDTIYSFQLCYNKYAGEHSLIWKENKGFEHTSIDDGEKGGIGSKQTPIITRDGEFDYKGVIDKYLRDMPAGGFSNKKDLLFVYDKLIEYTNL
jgi:hypothetical protein